MTAALRRTDQYRDTVIVFMSDNGGADKGSNWPLRGGKNSVWEGGTRTPAFVHYPRSEQILSIENIFWKLVLRNDVLVCPLLIVSTTLSNIEVYWYHPKNYNWGMHCILYPRLTKHTFLCIFFMSKVSQKGI